MTAREKAALIVCVALHAYVLWNVWQADKLTPRVLTAVACPRGLDTRPGLPHSSTL